MAAHRKNRNLEINNEALSDPFAGQFSRRTRLGLLVLLIVAVLFAGGALCVKYKLEELRAAARHVVESRTGARLRLGTVTVHGWRCLRIDGLEAIFAAGDGPGVRISIPTAYVYPDLGDLLNGELTVNRIEVDRSRIRLSLPGNTAWFSGGMGAGGGASTLAEAAPFRIVGKECELAVEDTSGRVRFDAYPFAFDVCKLSGSPDLSAKITGDLAREAGKPFKVDLRYTSLEDFDLRVHGSTLTADDIATYLPSVPPLLHSGTVSPSMRIAGYPGKAIVVAFESPFTNVVWRGQPPFLRAMNGHVSAMAQYDIEHRQITLTTAQADSEQMGGRIDGTISLAEAEPRLDLRLVTTRLPVADVLGYVMEQSPDQFGAVDLTLDEPCEVMATLKGTVRQPVFAFQGSAASGTFAFAPKDPAVPRGTLTLGAVSVSWSPEQRVPLGSFVVTDGTLSQETTGLRAEHVTGTLSAEKRCVHIEPFNAEITGQPFVGRMAFDYEKGRLELALNGTLADVEKTRIGAYTGELSIGGSLGLRIGVTKDGTRYTLDGDVDASQARMAYPGCFAKPEGIGANARGIHIVGDVRRSVELKAELELAGARVNVTADATMAKSRWRLGRVAATCDKMDIGLLGNCLDIPYGVSGGAGTNGTFTWYPGDGTPSTWSLEAGMDADRVSFHPRDNDVAALMDGVRVDVRVSEGDAPSGYVKVHARKASLPALRTHWVVPLRPNSTSSRKWSADLSAEQIELPPWRGTGFQGKAAWSLRESGFPSFSAEVDGGGHIEGTYHNDKLDNAYNLSYKWKDIQAAYLLEQLNCPKLFVGKTAGEMAYFLDRDDPGTFKGNGHFDVHDGRFSADFILSQLEGGLDKKITALPPSLKFSSLGSDIVIEGDTVTSPNLQLVSEGVKIDATGSYVIHGDLDYQLKVAVAPNMAERIPVLRDNFRVQGLRLAQQDIEFTFRVKGPIFNPKGEVAELPPLGITLVSSALEATSDAIRVIDIPRKLLADLFRIGGGIVGVTK